MKRAGKPPTLKTIFLMGPQLNPTQDNTLCDQIGSHKVLYYEGFEPMTLKTVKHIIFRIYTVYVYIYICP